MLLQATGVKFSGARAVVIGRSNIVGMPTALLLVRENATVTICHSRTENLPAVVREADILIAAIGRPQFVRGEWIKPGAVVIDVGINRVEDAGAKNGYHLVGDVDFEEARAVAGAITPVPGGVGPMTIAMLLKNTLKAAERASSKK
jgi:5,10-methylene-tetrahydrofolate dehydrogenase/methenyl tetrahydrofolate cyclohydrolase